MSIFSDLDFQIHLKKSANVCYINDYLSEGLQALKANIGVQFVFIIIKLRVCLFLQAEDETFEAMKRAAKEAFDSNVIGFNKMKAISSAYVTKCECSVRENVYSSCQSYSFTKPFLKQSPWVVTYKLHNTEFFGKKQELDELPDDSPDVFQINMFDSYLDRPNLKLKNWKHAAVDSLCFAEFLSQFFVDIEPCWFQWQLPNGTRWRYCWKENHTYCTYP